MTDIDTAWEEWADEHPSNDRQVFRAGYSAGQEALVAARIAQDKAREAENSDLRAAGAAVSGLLINATVGDPHLAEIASLRGLLQAVEWGTDWPDFCGVCREWKADGHAADCRLKAALG